MSNDWIPFHRSLTRGAKRGLPRAARFVYLELALEARAFDGAIPLPAGFKSDVDAVHDMLGGDRRELAAALEVLGRSHEGDEPMIRFEDGTPRRLVVVAFDAYQFRSDCSTPRVQKHRAKKREEAAASASATVPTSDCETVSGNGQTSAPERSHSTEQNRTTQDPPQPPEGERRLPRSEARLWGEEWAARYERGMTRALGRTWAFDRKHLGYLQQAVEKHCQDRARINDWVEKAAFEFGKATRHDDKPEVWSSWQAKGLFRWLNEGRPGWRAPAARASRPQAAEPPASQGAGLASPETAAGLANVIDAIGKGGN